MELLTASYRTWERASASGAAPVAISLTVPKWLPEAKTWPRVYRLCPRWSYFYADPAEFGRQYIAQLERFGVASIRDRLHQLGRELGAERLVLHCWEADGSPASCHRGTFARWWLEQTGELIEETQ